MKAVPFDSAWLVTRTPGERLFYDVVACLVSFYGVQWDRVGSTFVFAPTPRLCHTGCIGRGLWHWECKHCAVPVRLGSVSCWLLRLLYISIDAMYVEITYIDTMYCMWRCVHVLAWLNAPVLFLWMTTSRKLLKYLYFSLHFLHFFKFSMSVIQSSVGPVELSEKKQIYVYCLCMSVCA